MPFPSGPTALTTASLLIKIQSDVSVLIEPALFCHTIGAILDLLQILVRFAKKNCIPILGDQADFLCVQYVE